MENVMLNAIHTQIKIVDFGLSNIYTNSTPLRTHCGSPEYAAPELFVEGKHYGPEVDLWSLGVILYGMVIGQLPFANLRENALSAQERRTKLLVQINKGLSTTHRRALSLFSPEFKNMISKLLTPEPPKRITIKELIYHPWVTEKGRKSIRSNPMKKLDVQYQSVILKDAGSLLHLSLNEVEFAIRSEPQGSVAGIYNILAFRHTLRQMEGDGITRNLPEPDEIYTTPRPRAVVGKAEAKTCETKITSPSQRKELMKSAPITKFATPRTPVQTASVNKTCMKTPTKSSTEKSLKKRMIPKVLLSRLEKTNTAKPMPISDFVSPPKRSALSADEHKRSKLAENKSNSTNLTSHPISNILNLTRTPELLSPTSQGSPKVFSPKRKKDKHATLKAVEGNEFNEERSLKNAELRTVKLKLNKTTPKNTTTRTRSANGDIRPDLSPPTRRPLTGPIHTAERALKRRSLLPVMMSACTSHKDSAGTTTLATQLRYRKTQVLNKISDFHKQTPRLNENPEERAITPTKNQSARPMFEEPIARCITGYVVNNIPTKLSTFKWMKSTKKESS